MTTPEEILALFPQTKETGKHYQDFDTVEEATEFAARMRETHGGIIDVFQSGRRVYLTESALEVKGGP